MATSKPVWGADCPISMPLPPEDERKSISQGIW